MYEEAGLTDEVVVIFGDGEVVYGFLAFDRGGRYHPAPIALLRLYKISHAHLAGAYPCR
jgi:hypothetical protein